MVEQTRMTLSGGVRARGGRLALAALALAVGAAGCGSVFDVENPNQLVQEDLEKPNASTALVNGAEATLARGLADLLLAAAVPTDELVWVGSYDAGRELDNGFLTNPANEFTNSESWPTFNEGRWMADEAIRVMEEWDRDKLLRDRNHLARVYLYGAIAYTYAADLYDDFVLSNRKDAAPPVGPANMPKLYDTAIDYLTKALVIARETRNTSLEAALLAQRARTYHARAVRAKTLKNQIAPDPLVNSPEAVADAQAALAMVPPDWKYQFQFSATSVGNQLGAWINSRQEFRVDLRYGVPTTSGTKINAVALQDPIDKVADPALAKALTEFGAFAAATELYPPLTIVSARELRLILAEAALAQGNEAEAAQQINAIRRLDGLTPYSGQVPLLDLLVHSRAVNLFMQGRRLADMYRFRIQDARWLPSSDAVNAPGTRFPIADEELKSNCHLAGGC
ncbi:MAG TPA: RagB/SusD family nutrient uptake outer membrane protein [Longimicrobiaceae bacterium]|nr:RagB/SusD family nutrient uptake outer membrane protein [Longimicrobiaceae bacterium]